MKRLNQPNRGSAASKCLKFLALASLGLALLGGSVQAKTVTVTVVDQLTPIGAVGSFYWAITNCSAGDTIAFNITGEGPGPFYFQVPAYGFPLVYQKHNLLIDGYSQPGASANTSPITGSNNAVIMIVIDGRAGGSRNMQYNTYDGTLATSDPPITNTASKSEGSNWGSNEQALLGIYRSTNVNVRGLAFLGSFNDLQGLGNSTGNQKGLCIAQDYGGDTNVESSQFAYTNGVSTGCHINGCWFGVDPTNPTVAGVTTYRTCITSWKHSANAGRPEIDCQNLIIGVAPGSANPRAEFNVIVGSGCGFDGNPVRLRVSGNYFGVMPDGVTEFNPIALNTYWRGNGYLCPEGSSQNDTVPMIIGTDGDGVNDDQEGNLFGPLGVVGQSSVQAEINPSNAGLSWIIAGNRFGIGNNNTRWTNSCFEVMDLRLDKSGLQVRFGSDFNGVGDAYEGNTVYNNNPFSAFYPTPNFIVTPSLFKCLYKNPTPVDAWVSVRGNTFVNDFPVFNPGDIINNTAKYYAQTMTNAMTDSAGDQGTVPAVNSSSTTKTLTGTFSPPNTASHYTNAVVLDLYIEDPEGAANGALLDEGFFGGDGTSPSGWGFPQGKTYLGSYLVANPASGAFSFDISGLGLSAGTEVTAAITYSAFAQPNITSVAHSGGATTLAWTGGNGGPFLTPGQGGPTSGFGVQRAASLSGAWTTTYAAGNSITLADGAGAAFYRIAAPISGMTTLFSPGMALNAAP